MAIEVTGVSYRLEQRPGCGKELVGGIVCGQTEIPGGGGAKWLCGSCMFPRSHNAPKPGTDLDLVLAVYAHAGIVCEREDHADRVEIQVQTSGSPPFLVFHVFAPDGTLRCVEACLVDER